MRIYFVGSSIACAIGFVICYAISLANTAPYEQMYLTSRSQGMTAGSTMFFVALALAVMSFAIMAYVWDRDGDDGRGNRRDW